MKFFTKKGVIQKIAIVLLIILTFNFCVPRVSEAAWDPWGWMKDAAGNIANTLTRDILQFIASIGDLFMGALNKFMLGAEFSSAMVGSDDPNVTDPASWLSVEEGEATEENTVKISRGDMDSKLFGLVEVGIAVPNMMYSPEAIFGNKIAALDINFLNPDGYQYTSVVAGGDVEGDIAQDAQKKTESAAGKLKTVIASWYRTFRNLSVVILLIVLLYIGIRIVLSSTAGEKAKYKEGIKDWATAMALVFFIHVLMAGILLMTEKFTQLFTSISTNDIIVNVVSSDDSAGEGGDSSGDQAAQGEQTSSVEPTETVVTERASIEQAATVSIMYTEEGIKNELDKYKNGDKSLLQDPAFNDNLIKEWTNTLQKDESKKDKVDPNKNKDYVDLLSQAQIEKRGPLTQEEIQQVSNPENQDPTQPQTNTQTNTQQAIAAPSGTTTTSSGDNAEQPVAAADPETDQTVDLNHDEHFMFHTNLIGLARFRTQSNDWLEAGAYAIIYIVLIAYTYMFTFKYFARFLKMAFLTMIAPLVAITYPIDKMGDNQAQAFNLWFKEYLMNVIIQPVHLLLYTALIGTAFDLATSNLLYAIAAVAFLIPAENFIKEMFNIRAKSDKDYGLGMLSAGVLGKTALDALTKGGKGLVGGAQKLAGMATGGGDDGSPIRQAFNAAGQFAGLGDGSEDGEGQTDESGNPLVDGATDIAEETIGGGLNGAKQGMSLGAKLGSVFPGIGTALGGALGGLGGLLAGAGLGAVKGTGEAVVDGINDAESAEEQLDTDNASAEAYLSGGDNAGALGAGGSQSLYASTPGAGSSGGGALGSGSSSGALAGGKPPKPKKIKGWGRNLGKRALKFAGKVGNFGLKTMGSLAGAGVMGTIGAIAGAANGNVLGGLAAGLGAGGLLGWKVGGVPAGLAKALPRTYNKATDWYRDRQYNINKDLYGPAYAAQVRRMQQDKAAYKRFSKNEFQRERADQILADINDPSLGLTRDDVLRQTYEYAKYGVSNEAAEKMIAKEARETQGLGRDQLAHARYLTAAVKGEAYGADFFLDQKKVQSLRESLKDELGSQANADAVLLEMAEAKGHRGLVERRMNQATQQQRAAQRIAAAQQFSAFTNNKENIERAKKIQAQAGQDKDGNPNASQDDVMKALYAYEKAGINSKLADKALGNYASSSGKVDVNSKEFGRNVIAAAEMNALSEEEREQIFSDGGTNMKAYEEISKIVGTDEADHIMKDMSKIQGEKATKFENNMREKSLRNNIVKNRIAAKSGKSKPGNGNGPLPPGNGGGGGSPKPGNGGGGGKPTSGGGGGGKPKPGNGGGSGKPKPGNGGGGGSPTSSGGRKPTSGGGGGSPQKISNKPKDIVKGIQKVKKQMSKKEIRELEKKLAKEFDKEQKKLSTAKRKKTSEQLAKLSKGNKNKELSAKARMQAVANARKGTDQAKEEYTILRQYQADRTQMNKIDKM